MSMIRTTVVAMAQWGNPCAHDPMVAGSSPTGKSKFRPRFFSSYKDIPV